MMASLVAAPGTALHPITQTHVFLVGDSNSDPNFISAHSVWADHLDTAVNFGAFTNYAIAGYDIDDINTESGDVLTDIAAATLPRTMLMVMIGTNDNDDGQTGAQKATQLKAYLDTMIAGGVDQVCICPVVALDDNPTFINAYNSELDDLLTTESETSGRMYADFMLDRRLDSDFDSSANTDVYDPDEIHLNTAGHSQLGTFFVNQLLTGMP